ncbi:MAG: Tryptophan synthase alpha chain [Candidatus Dichloromethanomonas elyunquensis]|nr:MAG: Tryptophan synthase alpha chain [Candidatus Dichloromethanomonas elyunquensis]
MNAKTNRIDQKFQQKLAQGKKALITFITAGDPDLETTRRLVMAMEEAGADLVELGVPYSDPIAEGPVIQAANTRALKNDVRIDRLFELVSDLRTNPNPSLKTEIPLLFLLYVNCILQYGKAKFFDKCVEKGIDGLIIPDLPYEESEEIAEEAVRTGIRLIRLVAPSSNARIETIAGEAEGFLYCVSSLGVTGTRSSFSTDFRDFFGRINRFKSAPCAVGFGISSPEQVRELKEYCDGIIVGSAVVQRIAEAESPDQAVVSIGKFVKSLREALDQ